MNLLTLPFRLPLLPVRGVIRLAEIIRDEAEREYYDPLTVRRELEEVAEAAASGQISADEAAQREQEIVGRLIRPGTPAAQPGTSDEEG